MPLSLRSDAFENNQPIPPRHTCDQENLSPALSWSDLPQGTVSLALIVDDPDAPHPWEFFTHWVIFNMPATANGLPEGVPGNERLEDGSFQGVTGNGKTGYFGPCPPPGGPHRYRFVLHALNGMLDLQPGASKEDVQQAIHGRVLAQAELVGTYQRS